MNEQDIIKTLEVKSMVARLMAKEAITIQRGNFPTAFFDVESRILGLPMYATITEATTDLLIGHEIGHALFTPTNGWHDAIAANPKRKDLINIVEDIRVERKVRNEYPGLISIFRKGYVDLVQFGFFGRFDVNNMKFLDRVNLTAKTGIEVPFDDEERAMYEKCCGVETWEDVLAVVEDVVAFLKTRKKASPKPTKPFENMGMEFTDAQPVFADIEDEPEEDEDEDLELQEEPDVPADGTDNNEDFEEPENEDFEEPKTEDASTDDSDNEVSKDDSAEEKAVVAEDKEESTETSASDEPEEDEDELESDLNEELEFNLNKDIAKNSPRGQEIVHVMQPTAKMIEDCIVSYEDIKEARELRDTPWYISDGDFKAFVKVNRKFVSLLKKEFEMKKAAYQYSRSTSARKGTLDTNKMYTYKYDDNIFRQVTKLADAKSHGMIFAIDLSGSMYGSLPGVYRQALILAMFCKAVSIPFKVYGWTTPMQKRDLDACLDNDDIHMIVMNDLQMVELLTSDMNPKTYAEAFRGMYDASCYYEHRSAPSDLERLGATPYCEMLIALHHITRKFKARHNIQNMNIMILSDGQGTDVEVSGGHRWATYYTKMFGGKIGKMGSSWTMQAKFFMNNLKDVCGCNIITFNLINNRMSNIHNGVRSPAIKEARKELRKTNIYISEPMYGEDLNIVVRDHDTDFAADDEFKNLDTDKMTDAQIANAFIKIAEKKKIDRIFTTEFVKIVA